MTTTAFFFRTSDDGIPITTGAYGIKGGHAMSGYHAFELNYLAQIYIRTYLRPVPQSARRRTLFLYFKPQCRFSAGSGRSTCFPTFSHRAR